MAIGYTRTPFKSYTRGLTDTTISGGLDASGVVTAAGGFVGDLTGDVAASEVTTDTVNGRAPAEPHLFMPSAAEWPAVTASVISGGFTPTWLTRGGEFAGNAIDAISANNLTAAGTIVYDAVKGGRRGQTITANTSGFSAAVNDFAATNSVFGIWYAVTDAVAAQRSHIGRYGTTIYMLASIVTSGGGGVANEILVQGHDGTTAKNIPLDKVHTDGVPRLLLVHIDRTMNTMRARISAPGEAAVAGTVDITGWGSLTGGASPLFNYGYVNGAQNGDDCWLGGAFVRINADMTGANLLANIAAALGAE
jgi:hypothetical protein